MILLLLSGPAEFGCHPLFSSAPSPHRDIATNMILAACSSHVLRGSCLHPLVRSLVPVLWSGLVVMLGRAPDADVPLEETEVCGGEFCSVAGADSGCETTLALFSVHLSIFSFIFALLFHLVSSLVSLLFS